MGPPVGRAATGAVTVVVAQEGTVTGPPPGVRAWMYVGEHPLWPLEAQRGSLSGLERIATHEALQRRAAEMRGPYLDWIAGLGVRNDSFDWWASELAAKNVYTFLFQRLCSAGAAADLLTDDLLIVCSTDALAGTVAAIARDRGLQTTLRTGRARPSRPVLEVAHGLLHAVPRRGIAPPEPVDGDTLLATWVDDRSFDTEGRYRDPHFGPLPELLRERGESVSLLARLLPSADRRATLRRLAASGQRVYLPDALLTTGDWRAARRRAQAFVPEIDDDAAVAGVPATALARELVREQRISHTGALTYGPLVERLAATGARPARIILPWEGHAWESALTAAVRRHLPGTAVVGYDNLNFSSLALSLYPGAAELGIRPLPDRVVTNGPTFARILAEAGFPADRIRAGCALRHQALYADGALRPTRHAHAEYVLAAGSIDAGQTIEMVQAAHGAFGDDLLVKLHPASDADRIRRGLDPAVRYADRPLGDLLPAARAMVYTYSIVPYEALAAGVPPIFFQSQALLDLDQLEPTPDVRWSGCTAAELVTAADTAQAGSADPRWRRRAAAVVVTALAPRDRGCLDAFLDGG